MGLSTRVTPQIRHGSHAVLVRVVVCDVLDHVVRPIQSFDLVWSVHYLGFAGSVAQILIVWRLRRPTQEHLHSLAGTSNEVLDMIQRFDSLI